MFIERATERLGLVRVSFDIDNVCVGTYPRAVEVYNWVHGTNYRIEDVKSNWELAEWFRKDTTLEDPRAAAINFYNSREVMLDADPVAGAILVLHWLHKAGIEPLFISARPSTAKRMTYDWFGHWTPWIARDFLCLQNKGEGINPDYKVERINSEGIEFHFEDVAEDALEILKNTKATVVLVNQPWNQGFSYDNRRLIRSEDPKSMSNLAYAFLELAKHLH